MQEDKIKHCAIYTRKSSDEGLEQDFNSLDAQREAGEAYILSQQHEGWALLDAHYDDGGISGGTMERPGLQALLNDIENGSIDIVVVYKVDRLSRSIGDFAKMMDLFDKHGVSFVSVTQAFNTANSMGRLMLNVLLSFAQFEREVTGERIRDKVAASKKKGMWMGGFVPLGYKAKEGKLIVEPFESKMIQFIFSEFAKCGSITMLAKAFSCMEYHKHKRANSERVIGGGKPPSRSTLYKILTNRVYIGETKHHDKWYPGQHDAIVDQTLWDKAQNQLLKLPNKKRGKTVRRTPAPLQGLLFGPDGLAMTPVHTTKSNRKYRYYQTHTAKQRNRDDCPIRSVSAGDIEGIIFDQIQHILAQPSLVASTAETLSQTNADITERDVTAALRSIESVWKHLYHGEQVRLLELFIQRIQLTPEGIHIAIHIDGIPDLVLALREKQHQGAAA